MNIAIPGVARLTDTELVAKSLHIETSLTTNVATFATPAPSVANLSTARATLTTAINRATDGGRELVRLKNVAATEVRDLLTKSCAYVNGIAQGDLTTIALSGFDARRAPKPLGILDAPTGVVLSINGNTGELKVRWNARYGAKSYNVMATKDNPSDPAAKWELLDSVGKARTILTGLTPGAFYSVAVIALGSAGESAMSEPATSVAP